ncbi:MAG: pectin esterase [Subdoligranulum sp.]|nr:pectin esterase [Subdoligranulum sp.]
MLGGRPTPRPMGLDANLIFQAKGELLMLQIDPQKNLQEVFDHARPGDVIRLAEGEYRIKSAIFTPNLTLLGAGADRTRIVFNDYAKKLDKNGVEYNTFRTWTLAICADGVTMQDLSVVNDSLHPEEKGQEVALTVYGDSFTMERCRLTSTQDTLFLGPLPADLIERYEGFLPDYLRRNKRCRQRFADCLIEGTVDFIFGCGAAVFENCEIRSLADARDIGYAAAPAHSLEQSEGFRFLNCRFTAEKGVSPGSVYLARPWRDHGLCVFQNCTCGEHISPAGFDKWNDTCRDKTARFYEEPPVQGRVDWVKCSD